MMKTIILAIVLVFVFIIYLILSLMGIDVVTRTSDYFSFLKDGWNMLVLGGIAIIAVVSLILLKGNTGN